MDRPSNLLDLALGVDLQADTWPLSGQLLLIEDCVETTGSFVLHQLMKRILTPTSSSAVIFLGLAHPFSHYDRILRKLGCNLVTQRSNKRFFFFDMLMIQFPDGNKKEDGVAGLAELYVKLKQIISELSHAKSDQVTIIIDDLSLLEVATNGSSNHVLDFLHYCRTLTSEHGCSLVMLNHWDIYSSMDRPMLMLQTKYYADILIKSEPLATGLAEDVHGQLTVLRKGKWNQSRSLRNRLHHFHFRVKENGVEYFYRGSQS